MSGNNESKVGEDSSQDAEESSMEGLFNVIDESGEGFGFDLTPENLFRPILIGTVTLFSMGMLAGVPIGIAMGRSAEESNNTRLSTTINLNQKMKPQPVRPSFDGLKFAASTFGLGTLLCASFGVAGFYGIKSYYNVDSFEQFGEVMRSSVVPAQREKMENALSPVLQSVSQSAGTNLPEPVQKLQKRFGNSRFGRWVKSQVDESVTIVPDDEDKSQK